MIDPIELRKGSIFFDAGDEQSYFAIEYFEKDFAVYRNGSFKQRMDSDCFQPVELTPEILVEAGFKLGKGTLRNNGRPYYTLGRFYLMKRLYYLTEWQGEWEYQTPRYSGFRPKIKHLHQLQNLYHALTGQELQIDIKKLNEKK